MLKFLSKYKKDFIIGPIFKLIEAIIEVFLPFIIAQIINNLSNTNTSTIIKYTGIMLVLIIIGLACAVIAQYIAAKTSQGFGTELRNKLFSHVLKLSNKQIEKYGTSAIVNQNNKRYFKLRSSSSNVYKIGNKSSIYIYRVFNNGLCT